jgi:hypothetical protein
MIFGIRVLYTTSSSKQESFTKIVSGSHTLLKGVKKFLPVIPNPFFDLGEFAIENF